MGTFIEFWLVGLNGQVFKFLITLPQTWMDIRDKALSIKKLLQNPA